MAEAETKVETKVERTEFTVLKPFRNQRRLLAVDEVVLLRPDQAEWLKKDGYVAPVATPEKAKAKDAR